MLVVDRFEILEIEPFLLGKTKSDEKLLDTLGKSFYRCIVLNCLHETIPEESCSYFVAYENDRGIPTISSFILYQESLEQTQPKLKRTGETLSLEQALTHKWEAVRKTARKVAKKA